MHCDLLDFERKTHLEYVPQPGGDMANHEPWRMALAYLYQYVSHEPETLDLPFIRSVDAGKIPYVIAALKNKINAPLTSSAGRLFDAVAALTGTCTFSAFHAEAPMRLENIMDTNEKGSYEFQVGEFINPGHVIKNIVRDVLNRVPAGVISARFHRSVVNVVIELAKKYRDENGINNVVLSGGSFQNRFLITESENKLKASGFNVFTQKKFPSNDGGIALGQLAIASMRRKFGLIE
jgi:hydrogenase maturation protein HypF